jgi:hypothetical protein
VGFSEAAGDGFETDERPPQPGQWDFAKTFYRVNLRNFLALENPVGLDAVFEANDAALRAYFWKNRTRVGGLKRGLFYVVQAGRLQCLNGAYLSEADEELQSILLDVELADGSSLGARTLIDVETGEQIRSVLARKGQHSFSDNVRANFGSVCCFPGCKVTDSRLLVGSHIARWTDVPELRGSISNGLCLCSLHDRAFEAGLFTLDSHLNVLLNKARLRNSDWEIAMLHPAHGKRIQDFRIPPAERPWWSIGEGSS